MAKLVHIEEERNCRNCRFWVGETEAEWGICKRYPPQFNSEGASQVRTQRSDWCGEFEPVEKWVLPEGFRLIDPHSKIEYTEEQTQELFNDQN